MDVYAGILPSWRKGEKLQFWNGVEMSRGQNHWQWRKRLGVQLLCRAVCICNVASHWETHYLELWIISGKQCVVKRYFRREGRQGSPVHSHRRMRAGGDLGAQPPGFASFSTAHIRTRDINSIPTAETELILLIFLAVGWNWMSFFSSLTTETWHCHHEAWEKPWARFRNCEIGLKSRRSFIIIIIIASV